MSPIIGLQQLYVKEICVRLHSFMFGGILAHTPGGLNEYYLLGWRMTINCALYYFRQAEERKEYYLAEIHILGRKIYLVGMKMICWYVHTMY